MNFLKRIKKLKYFSKTFKTTVVCKHTLDALPFALSAFSFDC